MYHGLNADSSWTSTVVWA